MHCSFILNPEESDFDASKKMVLLLARVEPWDFVPKGKT